MIWLVFIGVVLMVLATLDILPSHDMTAMSSQLFGMDTTHGVGFMMMSMLLLGCAFLCFKFNQFHPKSAFARVGQVAVQVLLVGLMVLLFMLRTISTEQVFTNTAHAIPEHGYTITAKVMVHEISDSVYDTGSYYHQKAVLSDLTFGGDRLLDGFNDVGKNHKDSKDEGEHARTETHNPFAVTADTPESHPLLPSQMTVLLQVADVKDNKDGSNRHQLAKLHPATTAYMTLRITPITADPSASGFDSQRWLRTRHIHANARVLAVHDEPIPLPQVGLVGYLERFRHALRTHFYKDWHALSDDKQQARAVTLALLTGDRALISRATKDLYQFGGISHLLAISGMHVVLLATMLSFGVCYLTDRFLPYYQRLPRHRLRLFVMVGASMIYALFTGFDVPAVRTVYMLLAVAVAGYLALPLSSLAVLMWVGLGMIWLDPVMVWQAGFWLSFVAVALLMSYGEREFDVPVMSIKDRLVGLLKLQSYLFVAMLPVSLLFFGKVSLWGLFVNLFAIGLFGVVIVPINLVAGVIFVVLPSLADVLWGVSSLILAWLHQLLTWLQSLSDVWLYQTTSVIGMALFALGVAVWVAPVIERKFALVPLLAVAMMVLFVDRQTPFSVMVLDGDDKVSQVLIRQQGADNGDDAVWLVLSDLQDDKAVGHDKVASVLHDKLRQHGVRHLTGVIVQTPSHRMSDVVATLAQDVFIHRYWQAGQPINTVQGLPMQACGAGRSWSGQGLAVSAMTGWQMIDDERVWGCTIIVESELMPAIMGGIHHDYGDDDRDDQKSKQVGSRLIINGATHEYAWHMYESMCHDEQVHVDVWLGHSRHAVGGTVLAQTLPSQVIFTDKDTADNRERAELMMIELGGQWTRP
ncbi:ComEC/Rec2 family competence protein [Moraxella sp. K1664]|uniref:ComEC/Rec2 family competence protein n=1 Tax=Moraxella sp. K1664 TaxID=2780077 RepID=UPI001880534B|nr:ComEC/Rec2 family competence protein [Moraxella sp. K1664]MBE9579632.1 ComEC/Rec2 family competence protein [Moraxella sp. K1664]